MYCSVSRGTQSSKQVPSKQQTRNYKLVVARALPLPYPLTTHNVRVKLLHRVIFGQSPTFSSSISTPTSPVDSNLSSAGTLEVRDVPLHFSLVSELTGQSPFHRPCLDRRLQLVLCPRLVSPYDWRNTHPRQAFRRQVRLRV